MRKRTYKFIETLHWKWFPDLRVASPPAGEGPLVRSGVVLEAELRQS
jgi:hypothetical protein